ncbi:MAG TPA: YihY/virulence factor BrkB family protein, partial [Chthoniobacterales bacterium]|nr:YihY/virulence factor BrkB family protein [Chthoniobacterales bacterium]
MKAIKSPPSAARFSPNRQKAGESSGKTRKAADDNVSLKARRKPQARLVVWGVELLVAIGFDVARRFVRSWTTSLAKGESFHKEPAPEHLTPGGKASGPVIPPGPNPQVARRATTRSSLSPERFGHLFISAAKAWAQDKCPQLGAALAYYTVFALAPLVVVLLGIFGLIYGGSAQARDKILEQLGYYIDPSGVKVFQEIATKAAEPKAGFWAAAIGVVIALFSASEIFGQLQEALNTIWEVKERPG